MDQNSLIFVSYASPDRERVVPYHDALESRGFDVWIDFRRLKPGQGWDFEIQRALNRATLILVFISNNSVSRRGYVQREIKLALDKAKEKLATDIYLIPVLLDDDALIPDELKHVQFVRASAPDCVDRIEDAIRHQLQQLRASVAEAQGRAHVRWSHSSYRESWEGLPGYETEFQLVHFSSDQYPKIGEVTDIIRATLLDSVFNHRAAKLEQDHRLFNFGQAPHSRTNTWEAFPAEPKIIGKVLSTLYSVHWYGAGAAHPNQYFIPFCFLLEPLFRIRDLRNLFEDETKALGLIQNSVREQLLTPLPDGGAALEEEWVSRGTADWDSLTCFAFEKDVLEFSFAPYQVGPHARGPQFAKVPFDIIKSLMIPWLKNSLGLY
jgi:hypothetical protein